MRRVRLRAAELATLAAGYGSAAALTELRAGQLAVRRLQLRAVAQRSDRLPDVVRARLDAAMALIERTARTAPETAADILAHPLLSAWATACLGRLVSPDVPRTVPPDIEFGYLGGLAAAGAARAGIDFELAVPVWDGSVFLPTLGVVDLGCAGVATIRGTATGLTVAVADRIVTVPAPYHLDRPGWRARRTVRVAPDLTLAVEDTDPYGACFGQDHADRLTTAEFDRLRAVLVPAWRLIEEHHTDYALGIRMLLRSIVPLATPEDGGSVSGASRVAAGAVSLSIPDDPAELALLLIHEVQHMKLGELLDLVDLHAVDGPARHHAPWRADPRPVGALFQGVYAHLGVADFWRVRRRYTVGGTADRAEYEFAYWCEQTRRAAATLADCGELTDVGTGFVARLADTLALWQDEPVAPVVAAGVADLLLAAAVDWRLRNYVPADREAPELAGDRLAGRDHRPVRPPGLIAGSAPGSARPPRVTALISSFLSGSGAGQADRPDDRAFLAGDYPAAATGYRDATTRCPADPHSWVGLAMALRRTGHPGAAMLEARPDLVRALHAELRAAGDSTAPDEIAAWLAGGVSSAAARYHS